MNANDAILLAITFPLIASPFIYLIARLIERRNPRIDTARWLALITLLVDGYFLYLAGNQYLQTHQDLLISVGQISLRLDGITLLLAVVALGLGILVTIFSGPAVARDYGREFYFALLTAMIGTIIGLGAADDLFNLWVWFECMAICSYILVAFHHKEAGSLEAGIKYLTQSALGSVLVLFGIALVFTGTGTLDLDEIRVLAQPTGILVAAGAMFIIGFGVKSALVPLHTWLPDAHSQAPSGISAMLSGVVIEAGLVALLRVLGALNAVTVSWGALLLGFAAINMLVGNLMALRQVQVKRLLAYSSLSHMGYILLGIGVGMAFGTEYAAAGGFFHILTHAMMKGLAFLAAGAFLYCLHQANGNHDSLVLDDLNGASRKYPLAAFAFSVAVLALGGLPPLAGFMSKWQIFVGGFQTKDGLIMTLVIFAGLNSVLSLGYYAPIVNRLYRNTPAEIVENGKPVPFLMTVPLVLLTLGVVILGFWPSLVNWITIPAAQSLLMLFGG
ncbi:MAG: complex I subunit 5 family protein [Bellilinea sp.]